MGGGESSVHATHFQNDNSRDEISDSDCESTTHHISISNKMVERLVEDATVAGTAVAAVSPAASKCRIEKQMDMRDRILSEKLKMLDDSHSEKIGLSVEDVKATAKRIELRTANMMVSVDPVCEDCASKLVDCYMTCDRVTNAARCSEAVNAFSKCVQDTAVTRLRARTARDAKEAARRTRHVAQARHHALKDLSIPPPEVPT